jgi:hypothetical protein
MPSDGPVTMSSNDPFGDHSIILCRFTCWNSVSCHLITVLHPKSHVQAMTVAGVDTLCSFGLKIMDDHVGFWGFPENSINWETTSNIKCSWSPQNHVIFIDLKNWTVWGERLFKGHNLSWSLWPADQNWVWFFRALLVD